MKRNRLPLFIALLSLYLTACGSDGLYRFTLITGGEHMLDGDMTGNLIVTDGSATLPAGARLIGNIHLLSGSLIVDGRIRGDIFFLNGDLTIGPTAHIDGELNLGSESYVLSPRAVIDGQVNTGAGFPLPELPEQTSPTGWALLLRTLVSGSLLGLIALVLERYAPRAVGRVGEAAINHSLVSGAMGLLVGVVGISLLVTMAYTILLIPVTLLGLIVLGLGILYGWISLGVSVGEFGLHVLKRPVNPSAAAFFGTLVLVMGLNLLTSMPIVGELLWLAAALIGLGAVSLTRFGVRRFVPAADENLFMVPG